MQLQAANISIVITGGCDAHFGPLCEEEEEWGGRHRSLSALRRGLLMKPSESFLGGKEFSRGGGYPVCVCVLLREDVREGQLEGDNVCL